MTLIAAFEYSETQTLCLLGDALITTPFEPRQGIALPGFETSGGFKTASGDSIIGLEQKITVIDDGLAFAWAGNLNLATRFGNALVASYQESEEAVSQYLWEGCFNNFTAQEKNEFEAICVVRTKAGFALLGTNGIEIKRDYAKMAQAWVGGSGKYDFLNLLADKRAKSRTSKESITHALSLVGALYLEDVTTRETHQSGFGGFYDLVVKNQDCLCPMPKYLVINGSIDVRASKPDAIAFQFHQIFQFDPVNHLRIVRELIMPGPGESQGKKMRVFGVIPIVEPLRREAQRLFEEIAQEDNAFHSSLAGEFGKAKTQVLCIRLSDGERTENSVKVTVGDPIVRVVEGNRAWGLAATQRFFPYYTSQLTNWLILKLVH